MVFTVKDINHLLYPSKKSYTPNESYRNHSLILTPAQLRNAKVEELYGPFETKSFTANYSSPGSSVSSPRPKPAINGILKPLPRNEEKISTYENMTLEQLKKLIADREAQRIKTKQRLDTQIASTEKGVMNPVPAHNAARSVHTKQQPPIIVIEDDSSDNMDIESDDDHNTSLSEAEITTHSENGSDADDEQMNIKELESSREKEDDDLEMDKESSSSQESYTTAADHLMEEQDLIEEQEYNAEEISLLGQLQKLQATTKSIQVEVLGMKVRMSLNKNKNDTKKKGPPPAPLPRPGVKRNPAEAIHVDGNPAYSRNKRSRNKRQQDIPGLGYNAHIPPQQAPPFYQQLPTQNAYNAYVQQPPPPPAPPLPHMYYTPQPPPPPPPPQMARPVTPPPPPPPSMKPKPKYRPANDHHLPKPRPHIIEEKAVVESMKDTIQVENTLKDIEQLVSHRIFNDTTSHPKVDSRRSPRPVRLVTVDRYTMPLHMIWLNQDENTKWEPPSTKFVMPAGVPVEAQMVDSWYESPLFVMLRRKATGQSFSSEMAPIVQEIIDSIPPTDNLDSVKIGDLYFVNLEGALHVAHKHALLHPTNEFLAALRLELSFYVYGNTKMFHDDYNEIRAHIPLSVDVEWQRIRAEATFSSQMTLILELLRRISQGHTSSVAKESIALSSMTVEILIRVLRANGSRQVFQLLTNFEGTIDSGQPVILDIDDTPGLNLQESDKYSIWMLILFQMISRGLPEAVCSAWMNSLVKDGSPTKALSLFMVDWSTSDLSERPLDRSTLCGATNILLSMLRHFGKKAYNDVRRKPLLVGVLRTLSSFLSCNPSYKNAGTLLLVRKMASLVEQIPEIQEIMIELDIKVGNPGTNIVDHVYSAKRYMSLSNIYSLTYHVARYYYEKQPFNNQLLLVVSNILLYPLLDRNTKELQLKIMGQLTASTTTSSLTEDKLIVLVDTIRQRYLTAMGLDSLMTDNSNHRPSDQKKLCKVPFAWINLLLLTAISKFLRPEGSIMIDTLKRDLHTRFEEGLKKMDSDEGKLVLFKYGQQLQLI